MRILCESCNKLIGATSRYIAELDLIYYICSHCGKANRASARFSRQEEQESKYRIPKGLALLEELHQNIRNIHFNILVWGPTLDSKSHPQLAQKRRDILESLSGKGHTVNLSEELALHPIDGVNIPIDTQESYQLEQFDLVILIAGSYGSLGEFHQYALTNAKRMLIWLPLAAQDGFAGTGLAETLLAQRNPPIYFEQNDVKSCVLLKASEDWIQRLQILEFRLDLEEQRIRETRIRRKRND